MATGTGPYTQDLPTWSHFESAVEPLAIDQTTGSVPCGPELEQLFESIRAFVDVGYDHLYFHQIGPDQAGFFDFWSSTLWPEIADGSKSR